MRLITTLILLYSVSASQMNGQNVGYAYDARGNRTARVIELYSPPYAPIMQRGDRAVLRDRLGNMEARFFPNPTDGFVRVEISGVDELENWDATLFRPDGSMIESRKLGTSMVFDLSGQNSGIYVLSITDGGDNGHQYKIIRR